VKIFDKAFSTADVLKKLKITESQFEGMLRKRTTFDFDLKEGGAGRGKSRWHSIADLKFYFIYFALHLTIADRPLRRRIATESILKGGRFFFEFEYGDIAIIIGCPEWLLTLIVDGIAK